MKEERAKHIYTFLTERAKKNAIIYWLLERQSQTGGNTDQRGISQVNKLNGCWVDCNWVASCLNNSEMPQVVMAVICA